MRRKRLNQGDRSLRLPQRHEVRSMTAPIAVVLAGGPGTRLRPLTEKMPKAMVPVQGKPLTEHVLDILRQHGVRKVVLSLCYLAEQVRSHFGDGSQFGMEIRYVIEEKPLGTAGFLTLIKPPEEPFLVLNGDVLSGFDLKALMEFHRRMEAEHGAVATIALNEVDDPSRFGVADLDGDRILRFVEKPRQEDAPSNWINSGYYVLSPEVFSHLPDQERLMFEYDLFPLLAEKGKLFGFKARGQWFDTGTMESYERVKREWKGPRRGKR